MDLNSEGSRALVTGGTRGIGNAIVTGLLDEGASVAFCSRTAADVERVATELASKGTVFGSAVDVGDGLCAHPVGRRQRPKTWISRMKGSARPAENS